MKKSLKFRTLAVIIIFYLFIIVATNILSPVFLVYAAVCAYFTKRFFNAECGIPESDHIRFRRLAPLRAYGTVYATFEHSFHADKPLGPLLIEDISKKAAEQCGLPPLAPLSATDEDRKLAAPDNRTFHCARTSANARESIVTLAVNIEKVGEMECITWWVLVSGFTDPNKLAYQLAFSPFTLPFWIRGYLRKEYSVLEQVQSIYDAFYNDLDLLNTVKSLHLSAFMTLLTVLKENGVEIGALEQQAGNVMNINIKGGKATFGSIVQGALYRSGPRQGAKAA